MKNHSLSKLNFIGTIWEEKLSLLTFLQENNTYFATHDFDDVPESLLRQIEKLSKSRLLDGVWHNFTVWKKIVTESDKFLFCILFQPPFLLSDVMSEKLSRGIELKLLFGKNSDIPDCNDLVENLDLNKIRTQEKIKRRIVENVGVNIIMSEKECSLMFPQNGVSDMHKSFVSEDPAFLQWCQEFFCHKWNNGSDFSRLRTNS